MSRLLSKIALSLAILAAPSLRAAETSYLRPADVVVCVGDSISAQKAYQGYARQVLDTLYPDAKLRIDSVARGGAVAGAMLQPLKSHAAAAKATIVTVMFGVNDTGWSAGNDDAKIKTFVDSLGQYIDHAVEQKHELIFLTESHFSHGLQPGVWETGLNVLLGRLYEAQYALAAERKIPVVDTHGAYIRGLAAAWRKDPAYEFTPDIVHPSSPGHAVMAAEILKAFGAGLPLAGADRRGSLQLGSSPVVVEPLDDVAVVGAATAIPLRIRLRNTSPAEVRGDLRYALAGQTATKSVALPAWGAQIVEFTAAAAELPERWDALPLYAAFCGADHFAAGHALFHYSRVVDGKFPGDCFRVIEHAPTEPATVTDLEVAWTGADGDGSAITVDFTWKDETPVAALPSFTNRFNQVISTPVDPAARAGQPSDAVEFFVDTRPERSSARWTAGNDGNPEGMVRVGVYLAKTDDGAVARLQTQPPALAEAATLTDNGNGRYTLVLGLRPAGATVGFSARVTNASKYNREGHAAYYLTGKVDRGHEPMSFARLGPTVGQVFYRIGY